jgi:hypothetical protein
MRALIHTLLPQKETYLSGSRNLRDMRRVPVEQVVENSPHQKHPVNLVALPR